MTRVNIESQENSETQFDRTAAKLAEVVHRVVQKVVARGMTRLNSPGSASVGTAIPKSYAISKLKRG